MNPIILFAGALTCFRFMMFLSYRTDKARLENDLSDSIVLMLWLGILAEYLINYFSL